MNKIIKFTWVLFSIALFPLISISQGIEFFHGNWEEVLAKAKKNNKAIFVDAYTTWCGPCKAMAKNVFTKSEVGDFFNKNFINVKFDMEKEDGVKFGHTYPVSAYPTLYFIDQDGEVLKKVVGGQKPETLIQKGKDALKQNDRSGDYEAKYLEGDRSYELVFNYVKALNDVDKPSLKISNDYLASNPKITEEQRLRFMFEAAVEADSKIFEEVLAEKKAITALVGTEIYDAKMLNACKKTFNKSIEYEFEDLMHESIQKAEIALTETTYTDFAYTSKMAYYDTFNEKSAYYDAAKDYVKESGKKNSRVLSYVAMDVCNNLKDDEKALKQAYKWAKKAYQIDESEDNLNVYCRTLIAMKEYDKVLDIVNSLIEENNPKYSKRMLSQIKNYTENLKSNQG